jgi:hypothetical protein
MAEASKAVAEKKATEVAAFDFAQLQKDAGKGNENVGKDDLALPFIKILSGVDPMMDKHISTLCWSLAKMVKAKLHSYP